MADTGTARRQPSLITPVLAGGAVILMLGFAVRSSFGVFQIPIAAEFGWPRVEFSLAIAIQNLAWGIGQPVFAAIGERFGDRKAIVLGALLYVAGLVLSAFSTSPGAHQLLSIVIGCGVAGTGFGVILGMVGRAASDKNRSMTLGIATAAGSAGQVVGPPTAAYLLGPMNWPSVFLIFAAVILACLALLPLMRAPAMTSKAEIEERMGAVLGRALRDPNYILIFLGFFSCGYQLAFVTAHFPAFVTEMCAAVDPAGMLAGIGVSTTSQLGAWAIGLIGIANIAGTILAGKLGAHYQNKELLGANLHRPHVARDLVHHGADDADYGDSLRPRHGLAVAGDCTADLGADRRYLRPALYGNALRHRVLLAPARRLPRGLDGRHVLRPLRLLRCGLVGRRRRRGVLGRRAPADPGAARAVCSGVGRGRGAT